MTLIFILITILVASPFGYMVGRVHGINQAARAMERYGKAIEAADGKKVLPAPPAPPKKNDPMQHSCGGRWGKWEVCKVNLVTSAGAKTGNSVSGQRRDCTGCGIREVRTDI